MDTNIDEELNKLYQAILVIEMNRKLAAKLQASTTKSQRCIIDRGHTEHLRVL